MIQTENELIKLTSTEQQINYALQSPRKRGHVIDLTSSSPEVKKSKKNEETSKKCKCGLEMNVYWRKQMNKNIPYLMCNKRLGKFVLALFK